MDEYEWWAGRNEKEVKAAFSKINDEHNDPETWENFREVDGAGMDQLVFFDEDDNKRRTFRQQLDKMIENGEDFPCSFAATEYW